MKLSFRPNFQQQELAPAPVRKQKEVGKRPVEKEDELDTAAGGPAFPTTTRESSDTEEEKSTVRRSTRRAAPRTTKTSGLVPLHGLSDDFELLDDEVEFESNKSSLLSNEGNRRHGHSRTMMPPLPSPPSPPRRTRWDEPRQQEQEQELAAADPDPDLDPYTSGPSGYASKDASEV